MKRSALLFLFATFAVLGVQKILAAGEIPASLHETSGSEECCDCQCQHCGCQSHCHPICHPVCEWKDVKETVYSCRCSDICIPGRSEKLCTKIDECNPDNCPLCHDYKPLYTLWNPAECARSRSVTKLYKQEVSHKVPTYKWVVEYCCDSCCNQISKDTATAIEAGAAPKPTITPSTAATQVAAASKPRASQPAAPQITQPQIGAQAQRIAAVQQMPAPPQVTMPQIPQPQFTAAQQPIAAQQQPIAIQAVASQSFAMQPAIPAQQGNIVQLATALQPPSGIQPTGTVQPANTVQQASAVQSSTDVQEMGLPREFSMISLPLPELKRQ